MAFFIEISRIKVGERRREDYGDLKALAESIAKYGLLHPIVIDSEDRLICGERRLRACRDILGWTHIDVSKLGDLTDAERRAIELEENIRRKDLDSYELAKWRVTQAAEVAQLISPQSGEKDPRGRKSTYGVPKEDIADALGISHGTLGKAEQHVETAETFPFMQGAEWKQYHVLEAREKLSKLTEEERPKAAAMVSRPATPVVDAMTILTNLSKMNEAERAETFRMFESSDSREHSLSLTRTAEKVPEPDPRAVNLGVMIRTMQRMIRTFPNDSWTPKVEEECKHLEALLAGISASHKERVS